MCANGRLVAVIGACESLRIMMIPFSACGVRSGSLKRTCPRWLVKTSTGADWL